MRKFLAGFGFRTSTPVFSEGQELSAFVTGHSGDTSLIRVGDSVIRLPGESIEPDTRVRVRVTRFDTSTHEGEGELLAVEGDGAF